MQFQTRSEVNGLRQFPSMRSALEEAARDNTVWKISFHLAESNEQIRLTLENDAWVYNPIDIDAIRKGFEKK